MKLTNKQLRQIIKEELENVMREGSSDLGFTTVLDGYKQGFKGEPKSFDYNNGLFAYTEDGIYATSLDPDENGGMKAVKDKFQKAGYRQSSVAVKGQPPAPKAPSYSDLDPDSNQRPRDIRNSYGQLNK